MKAAVCTLKGNPQVAREEALGKALLPWRAEGCLESKQGAAREEGLAAWCGGTGLQRRQDVAWAGKPDAMLLDW